MRNEMYGRKTLIREIFFPKHTCETPINVNHGEMSFCKIPLGNTAHLPLSFQLETQQLFFSFFFLFVVDFVIHWNETAMGLHVFPIPIPPPTSLSTRSLWVFPVHQAQALVSCTQPGLVICFTLNNPWKRYVHPNVHRSTVYHSQDMEAT